MNERYTYDPEDLESLMRHKSFSELYPEEREFVLKHLSGEDEYTSMRTLLETLESAPDDTTPLREDHKAEVMAAYRQAKHRPQFSLNQFFAFLWPADRNFYQRPAFALGVVVLLIAGFVVLDPFSPNTSDGLLAEHVEKTGTETETETEMETETEAETGTEAEIEMDADSFREETDSESQVAESADVNKRVLPESVEEVMADELLAEVDDEEIIEEDATASAEFVEDDVDTFDQLADVPNANRAQYDVGAPAQDAVGSVTHATGAQITIDSATPIENPVITYTSPDVISSKSVSAESVTSMHIEELAPLEPVELLPRKDQKKLMKLMYSAY